jgi:tetratricopeptide (TPR) repeat protein
MMRTKTLLSLLLVFLFVWFLVATIKNNTDPVDVNLAFIGTITLEKWVFMWAAFGAGAALILIFDIAGGARRFARSWKERQLHRAREKTEDLYLRGLDAMINGRHELAVKGFDQVLERDPDHLNSLIKRGDCLRTLQRFQEAAESLERAGRLAPENLVALYGLSDAYIERGDEGKAEDVLKRIIEIDPETTVSAHRKLRDLMVRRGEWKVADELQMKIETMVTLAEEKELARATFLGIRFDLGRDQLAKGEIKEAIASFSSVIKRDDGFVPAYLKLGEAQLKAGDNEEALSTWRKGHQSTGSMEFLNAVQNYYLKEDQPEEAIRVWKQAIVLSENEEPLRYCLGKLYYRLFMLDAALNEFKLIEDSVSGLPALHVYIARILENKGDLQGAVAKNKTVLGEVAGLMTDYSCSSCKKRFTEWKERCGHCRKWNTVALDIGAKPSPDTEIRPAPTWSTP